MCVSTSVLLNSLEYSSVAGVHLQKLLFRSILLHSVYFAFLTLHPSPKNYFTFFIISFLVCPSPPPPPSLTGVMWMFQHCSLQGCTFKVHIHICISLALVKYVKRTVTTNWNRFDLYESNCTQSKIICEVQYF